MGVLKYPHLFSPLAIGDAVFKNRIFASPEGYYNVGADNLPSREEVAFFERKAIGGYASVCVGDCIVDSKTGTHYPFLIRMDDPATLPGLSSVAEAVSRHGAIVSAELNHAGMYARFVKDPDGELYGPEAAREAEKQRGKEGGPLFGQSGGTLYGPVALGDGKYGAVEAMSEEMILYIAARFGKAAAWAKRCGFTMVTVHGGHGWLLAQFMSPCINTRADRWGGSLENRMRFPLAVIESVRQAVGPRFPIEIRISGSECDPAGYDLDEGIRIAKALDGKADIIHVSAGNHEHERTFVITHPSMFLPDGANLRFAAEIKKHVKTPVATVGALCEPEMMEEIIASGKADIVQLGRQTLADPDLPLKARGGQEDDINKCMRCCSCFSGSGSHRLLQCAINPAVGHEIEERFTQAPRLKKRVLVMGGGVAGMQAALTAAQRGHEVILCEKKDALGGVLLCEEQVPFKARLGEYLALQKRRVERAPIDLRLRTELTPALAAKLAPDAIIAAPGSVPAVPPVPGIDGANVLGAEELYLAPARSGRRLIILGGGLVGLELAVFMAMSGRSVTVIELMPEPAVDPYGMHTIALMHKIEEYSIDLRLSARALAVTPEGLRCEGPDGETFLAADTVVYATGRRPLRAESFALHDCAPEFHQIGDCLTPKNIVAATKAAYAAAVDIGRI
jgi:2,4-dienoyl-CoA reductase-like NADH-dependent reductase (Old Yellow Enzyme family)/nucleoside-diphosphate-sugar epimerase